MKHLVLILAVFVLAGCESLALSPTDPRNQMNINRHDDPKDIYFGSGPGK